MMTLGRNRFKKFDYFLLFIIFLLTAYGFFSIYIATGTIGSLKSQGAAFILGMVAVIILSFMDYDIFGRLYIPIYIISNVLLLVVIFAGTGGDEWGADSWLVIGGFNFQPSEFVKLGIILSLAKFIEKNEKDINNIFTLIKILIFAGIPILLVVENDFGTGLVFIFFTFIMLFAAGLNYRYIIYSAIAGIISLPILWLGFLGEYQKYRILVFFDPSLDTMDAGYHVTQSKTAIGSGQIMGRYFTGEASFAKLEWLPEKHTDFIFAVIGEAFGLIGGAILIFLFLILLYRLIIIAKNAKDSFGSLTVIGITAMITFHIIENIGMTIGLMPVTGIPLPFISFGGTFMLTNMIAMGFVFSIAMRKSQINF
ncbi:rod shape-determining protein RodA [Clostridium sp. D2Q-11]|uniref:Rod shape-determining protein RodA n=1 Tax=Anaeromonas frigoriresistens TaxID=2683708 RepID=A0A942UVS4_9FIRM|nr:rod shape-determining protein RodA [Anaeromonas frigoriresistens]MBS4537806.1 rod shape-determining protein RodA [Anaeromonas frigoriresistens]